MEWQFRRSHFGLLRKNTSVDSEWTLNASGRWVPSEIWTLCGAWMESEIVLWANILRWIVSGNWDGTRAHVIAKFRWSFVVEWHVCDCWFTLLLVCAVRSLSPCVIETSLFLMAVHLLYPHVILSGLLGITRFRPIGWWSTDSIWAHLAITNIRGGLEVCSRDVSQNVLKFRLGVILWTLVQYPFFRFSFSGVIFLDASRWFWNPFRPQFLSIIMRQWDGRGSYLYVGQSSVIFLVTRFY
jgi:hypothetical protein